MKLASKIWFRAFAIYFCCMLPTLLIPPIFLYAVGLALLWSIPALAIFILFTELLYRMPLRYPVAGFMVMTLTGMALCFMATCCACQMMADYGQSLWRAMEENIIFPLIAWIAAAISLGTHYKSICSFFSPDNPNHNYA